MHYCQHLSVSNCSIKAPACQPNTVPYDVDESSREGDDDMNGLLDPMFNFQRSEIFIYHRHNEGEPEWEEKKVGRETSESPSPVSTSWTEYQLELLLEDGSAEARAACERALRSRAYHSRECFHILFSPLSFTEAVYLINGDVQIFSSFNHTLIPPLSSSLSGSCSIQMYLANIHHWASLLCLRLNSIHPNICMLSNLEEEWNNLTKTNQSFIKLLSHTSYPTTTPLSAPSVSPPTVGEKHMHDTYCTVYVQQ